LSKKSPVVAQARETKRRIKAERGLDAGDR
jgi:hypothetical protein